MFGFILTTILVFLPALVGIALTARYLFAEEF